MKWEKVHIADICEIKSGKRIPKGFDFSPITTEYRYIRAKDIKKGKIDCSELGYISKDVKNKIAKYIVQKNDVVISIAGTIGEVGYVPNELDGINLTENAVRLTNFTKSVYSKFVLYWLMTEQSYEYMNSVAAGSAQPKLGIYKIEQIPISLPPLDIQHRIADILSAYDDLIENNRKQIKLLEEAAQRLYKEWFVDLRFPGYEHTKNVDGVPEGWETATLGDICSIRKETLPPSKIDAGVPYIGLEHMPRKDICLSEWGNSSEVSSNKFRYYEDDILFGKIRPYFHKVGFALNSGITSTDAIILKSENGLWALLLMTISSTEFVNYTFQNCKEGAKMPRADWNQMKAYPILIAHEEVQKSFENYIYIITRNIRILALQNRILAEARDRLLPKLMSGEVEV